MPKPRENTDRVIEWPSRACCEAFGISPQQLAQLVANGTLEKLRYGVFDGVATTRAFIEHLALEKLESNGSGDDELQAERLRWLRLRGDRAQIELDQARGKLIAIDEVTAALVSALVGLRTLFLGRGPRLAPQLAATNSATRCAQLVDQEIRRGLEDFASAKIVDSTKTPPETEQEIEH
jgi:hypothetical protein